MSEKSKFGIPIENTRSLTIDIAIQYTVPVDPSIISGNEITSSITLYEDNTANTRPTISYSTNDKIFFGNAIDDINIILPSNTKFSPLNVKVCCVAAASAFPGTGCSGSGHSAYSDLIIQSNPQTNVNVAIAGEALNLKTAQPKEYLMDFVINSKLLSIPKTAQTCRLYLESTFKSVVVSREINHHMNERNSNNELLSTIVKSQKAFTISEPLLVESDVTGTIAKESSFVIIISSTIVITGLVIAGLIASIIVIYYTMKRKDNNNATKAMKLEESSSIEMPTMV